jgi:hypothetical protein
MCAIEGSSFRIGPERVQGPSGGDEREDRSEAEGGCDQHRRAQVMGIAGIDRLAPRPDNDAFRPPPGDPSRVRTAWDPAKIRASPRHAEVAPARTAESPERALRRCDSMQAMGVVNDGGARRTPGRLCSSGGLAGPRISCR